MRCVQESPHKNRSTSCVCVCVCVLYYMEAFCFIVVKEPLTNSRHPCHVGCGTTSAPLLTQELFLVGAVQRGLMSLLWKTVSTGIHTRDMCCWVGWPRSDTKAAAPCGSVKGFWEGLLYINVVLFFFLLNSGNAQSPLSPHHPVDGVSPQTAELRLRLPLHQEPRAAGLHLR